MEPAAPVILEEYVYSGRILTLYNSLHIAFKIRDNTFLEVLAVGQLVGRFIKTS